jgi:hypothetical protein
MNNNQMKISRPRFEYLLQCEPEFKYRFTRYAIQSMYDFFDKFLNQIYPNGLDFTRICAEWEETPIFIYQPDGVHCIHIFR